MHAHPFKAPLPPLPQFYPALPTPLRSPTPPVAPLPVPCSAEPRPRRHPYLPAQYGELAQRQRDLLLCAVALCGALAIDAAWPGRESRALLVTVLLLQSALTFRLAVRVTTVYAAVAAAVAAWVPVANLLTLLALSQRASCRLLHAGYRVGGLGADPKQFE